MSYYINRYILVTYTKKWLVYMLSVIWLSLTLPNSVNISLCVTQLPNSVDIFRALAFYT